MPEEMQEKRSFRGEKWHGGGQVEQRTALIVINYVHMSHE